MAGRENQGSAGTSDLLRMANKALAQERRLLAALMDHTPDHVYFKDGKSRFIRISKSLADHFGLPDPDEAIGKTDFSFFSSEHAEQASADERDVIKTGRAIAVREKETWPDGRETWVSTTKAPLRNKKGRIVGTFGISRDISDRKRAEEALQTSREQLRSLAAGLQAVREEERTRLARKIHDELGHALAAAKMDLAWLDKKLTLAGHIPQDGRIRDRMKSILELLDATIASIRETASDLRPGLLDDLGLSAALEWMIKQFQRRTKIRCTFASSAEDVELDRERSTALYRICQELLTNVANHADAKAVHIALEHRADELFLTVSDDGKGITQDQMSSAGSLGILGIRERVLILGGQVHIAGASGEGTTAMVQIPLSIEESPESRTGDPPDFDI